MSVSVSASWNSSSYCCNRASRRRDWLQRYADAKKLAKVFASCTYLLTNDRNFPRTGSKLAQLGGKPRNWQRWLRTCFAGVGVGEDEALNSFFVDVVEARHARAVRLRERTVRLLCNVKTLASSTPLSPLFLQ